MSPANKSDRYETAVLCLTKKTICHGVAAAMAIGGQKAYLINCKVCTRSGIIAVSQSKYVNNYVRHVSVH